MDAFREPIIHIDMDAFFVEVERLDEPSLVGKPVVVGGGGARGVVASASYEARSFGVQSAMPTAWARRLCPRLVVVSPDHGKYSATSRRLLEVLTGFTPAVESISVDEAFLDVSGLRLHYPGPAVVALAVRDAIQRELSLPASAGVARNKLLAKLASEYAKPDGMLHVPRHVETEFLHALPARALSGIGEATFAALEGLGVKTVGDIASISEEVLRRRLGESLGAALAKLSRGEDDRPVVPTREAKSVSVEETYPTDLKEAEQVNRELLRLADRLASRLRRMNKAARTITLKVRFGNFRTVTRSVTVPRPTVLAHDLYGLAHELADRAGTGLAPVRLLGIGATQLEPASAPRQLATEEESTWKDAEEAIETIRERFGAGAIRRAALD